MSDQNLYDILGVRRDASSAEIRAAYLKLAKQWHPDRNTDNAAEAERRFKGIAHAYEVLSDPQKRAAYDAGAGGEQSSGFEDTMDDDAAFDLFVSVLLDLAFELAESGADQIAIYQALIDMGCPSGTAKTLAQRAHKLGGDGSLRGSRDDAGNPQFKRRAGKGDGGSSGGHQASNAAAAPNDPDSRFIAGPWSRWFARSLDILVGTAVASPLIGWLFQQLWTIEPAPLRLFAYVIAISPIPLIVDALIVGFFGNSLGKALLKIRVLHKVSVDGTEMLSPIGFEDALLRNFFIWVKGYWLSVPVLAAISQFLAYLRVSEGKPAAWDMRSADIVVPEKISEVFSPPTKEEYFFVLRDNSRWELIFVFVICTISLPFIAKVGGEIFTGPISFLSAPQDVEVAQGDSAPLGVAERSDGQEIPQYNDNSQIKDELVDNPPIFQRMPTVDEFNEEIENAMSEFTRVLLESGISGAERYSRGCQDAARRSQDILDTDFCVAFDTSAMIADYAVSQESGGAYNQYFQLRSRSLESDYSRFPQAAPGRTEIIYSQVYRSLGGHIQGALDEYPAAP